jgi:hypothetical protein
VPKGLRLVVDIDLGRLVDEDKRSTMRDRLGCMS